MVSKLLITHVESLLREQIYDKTRHDNDLRVTSLSVLSNFLFMLHKKMQVVGDVLEGGKKEKTILLNENGVEFSLTINPYGNSKVRYSIIQSAFDLINHEKMMKYIENPTGFVYFIKSDFGYKIGMTKSLDKRLKVFEVKLPFQFTLFCHIASYDYKQIEIDLHDLLSHERINGEWFNLSFSSWKKVLKYCIENNLKIIKSTENG